MVKKRKIYALNMSYEVPDEDRDRANKIVRSLDHMLKIMQICNDHLDLIYTPFKDHPDITPEQVYKIRAALRRYRDKVAENFNVLKRQAFRTYVFFQPFASDTQVAKLSKSFVLSIGDLEKQVNRFIDLFSNLQSKDFAGVLVKAIDNIKKELSELEQIIEDRIKSHIQNNILAKNWVDNISDELQEKVENRIPLSIELVEERNKKQ